MTYRVEKERMRQGTGQNYQKGLHQAAERLRGTNRMSASGRTYQRFNYNNVLIYADPPYMLETRHGKQYRKKWTIKPIKNC